MIFLFIISMLSNPTDISDPSRAKKVSLHEILTVSVKNNRVLKGIKLTIKQIATGTRAASAKFGLNYNSKFNFVNSKADAVPGSFFSLTDLKKFEFEAGIQKLLETGGVVSVGFSGDKTDQTMLLSMGTEPQNIETESYSASLTVMISHPILAGFGLAITKAEIEKSKINLQAEELNLQAKAEGVVRDIVTNYWDLTMAWNQYGLLLTGLKVAESQLKLTKALMEGDRATLSDLLAVKTAVAQRKGELLIARRSLLGLTGAIKSFMGADLSKPPYLYKPTTSMDSYLKGGAPENLFKMAIKRSKELAILDKKIEILRHDQLVAENSLLPQLDATMAFGPTTADRTFSNAIKRLVKFEAFTVSAGLSFNYSIAKRDATRASLSGINIARNIIRLQKNSIKAALTQAALFALDGFQSSKRRIKISKMAVSTAKAHLEKEKTLFEAGRGTNHSVLLRLQTLEQAKISLVLARRDLIVSQVQMEALAGKILKIYGLAIK
jgi:outer membrane protein TolC